MWRSFGDLESYSFLAIIFRIDNINRVKNNRQQRKRKCKISHRTSACAQKESLWILWISAAAIVRL